MGGRNKPPSTALIKWAGIADIDIAAGIRRSSGMFGSAGVARGTLVNERGCTRSRIYVDKDFKLDPNRSYLIYEERSQVIIGYGRPGRFKWDEGKVDGEFPLVFYPAMQA
jgi:hypothetical protein